MSVSVRTLTAACLLLIELNTGSLCAAEHPWQGKRAAVALTYDDALNVHLDKAAPALNAHQFRGTFYLTIHAAPFSGRLDEWRKLAEQGHELGNHTLFHPCDGQKPGREWVSAERDLSQWSPQRVAEQIKVGNTALAALDGKSERTFAYPCGDTEAGGESYIEAISPLFIGARGVTPGYPRPAEVNLFNIDAHMINGQRIDELKAMVDTAIAREGLLVFLFHGVGGEHSLNIDEQTHTALLDYLSQRQEDIWVAPMIDIVRFVHTARP